MLIKTFKVKLISSTLGEHVLQCKFGMGMAMSHAIMAEFKECGVGCPCTGEKKFRHLDSFPYAQSGEFELRELMLKDVE